MLAVAKHTAEPLEAQAKDETVLEFPETATLIPRLKATIDLQIERLQTHLDDLGGNASAGLKNAVVAMMGSGAAAIDKMRKTKVSKMLRDNQTALSLMTISYEMLHVHCTWLRATRDGQPCATSFG